MENTELEQNPQNSDEQLLIFAVMRCAFFKEEMKKAFMHGRKFEQLETEYDKDGVNVDDKHLPFYEWFAKHYTYPDTHSVAVYGDKKNKSLKLCIKHFKTISIIWRLIASQKLQKNRLITMPTQQDLESGCPMI